MLSSEDRIMVEGYFQKNLDENTMAVFLERLESDNAFFEEVLALQILLQRALEQGEEQRVGEQKDKDELDFRKTLGEVELDIYLEEQILKPLK